MEGIVMSRAGVLGDLTPNSFRASACEAEILDAEGFRREWAGTAPLQPTVRRTLQRLAGAAEARVTWEKIRD